MKPSTAKKLDYARPIIYSIISCALAWTLIKSSNSLVTSATFGDTADHEFNLIMWLGGVILLLSLCNKWLSRYLTDHIPGAYATIIVDEPPRLTAQEYIAHWLPQALIQLIFLYMCSTLELNTLFKMVILMSSIIALMNSMSQFIRAAMDRILGAGDTLHLIATTVVYAYASYAFYSPLSMLALFLALSYRLVTSLYAPPRLSRRLQSKTYELHPSA